MVLVDRIKQRAISWSTKHLSGAGKFTMLKSVLSALPTYTMSCFQLPKSLIKRIQSALTRFWWDSNTGARKMCWKAWTTLAKPKALGGLGFRDIEDFNNALLAKLSWRLLVNPHCLLSRVLYGKYCKDGKLLTASAPGWSSHGWRSIISGKEVLKLHTIRALGDGKAVDIWNEPWLPMPSCRTPIGPVLESDKELKVADFLYSHTKEWDVMKIQEILPGLEATIQLLKPSRSKASDSFAWTLTQDGIYTTKSGYLALAHQREEAEPDVAPQARDFNWYKQIWHRKVSPKLQIFLWKAAQNALPTGANMGVRGLTQREKCCRCNEKETLSHLLFDCDYAQKVWQATPFTNHGSRDFGQHFKTNLMLANSMMSAPPIGITTTDLFSWTCWAIWKSRNQLLFQKQITTIEDCSTQAIVWAKEWEQTQQRALPKPTIPSGINPNLQTLPEDHCVLYTDAAWNEKEQKAGLGWVIRELNGSIITSGTEALEFIISPLMAEAQALFKGLKEAQKRNLTKLKICSDAQLLVKAISTKKKNHLILGILSDIERLKQDFEIAVFQFIPRKENEFVDLLAKNCLRSALEAEQT